MTDTTIVGDPKFSDYARKTVVALIITVLTALASALGILLAAMASESDGGGTITGAEWVKFAIALVIGLAGALGTSYGVYQATNYPQTARGLVPVEGEGPTNGPGGVGYPRRPDVR